MRESSAQMAEWDECGFGCWIALLESSQEPIGYVGLSVPMLLPEILPAVEVGWRFDPAFWGQGLANEGARAAAPWQTCQLGDPALVHPGLPSAHGTETHRAPRGNPRWRLLDRYLDRAALVTPEENRARVLDLFEDVVNAHDESAIERFTTSPPIQGTLRGLLAGFPDLRFEVEWTVAEADRVVAFIEMSGTQAGPFLMVQEPTDKPLRTSIMLALQLDTDGMVTDSWLGTNFISMLGQLGWGVAPEGQQVPLGR